MKITLKDGSVKEYQEAKTVYEIASDISEGLARVACAGEVNGEIVDLRTEIKDDCELNIVTASDPEGLRVIRHTASHILAEAVKRLQSLRSDLPLIQDIIMILSMSLFQEMILTRSKQR